MMADQVKVVVLKPPRTISACERKIRYGHMETAQSAAEKMATKQGRAFEAYGCPHCGGFHVGKPLVVDVAAIVQHYQEQAGPDAVIEVEVSECGDLAKQEGAE